MRKGKIVLNGKTYELYSWYGLELFSLAERNIVSTLLSAEFPEINYVDKVAVQIDMDNVKAGTTMYIYDFTYKAIPDAETKVKVGFAALPPELRKYAILFSPLRDAAILVPLRACKWYVHVPASALLDSHE